MPGALSDPDRRPGDGGHNRGWRRELPHPTMPQYSVEMIKVRTSGPDLICRRGLSDLNSAGPSAPRRSRAKRTDTRDDESKVGLRAMTTTPKWFTCRVPSRESPAVHDAPREKVVDLPSCAAYHVLRRGCVGMCEGGRQVRIRKVPTKVCHGPVPSISILLSLFLLLGAQLLLSCPAIAGDAPVTGANGRLAAARCDDQRLVPEPACYPPEAPVHFQPGPKIAARASGESAVSESKSLSVLILWKITFYMIATSAR